MPDSAPSAIVTATSPAQVPAAPVINFVHFLDPKSLVATVNVALPEKDANGNLYPSAMEFAGVKIFFGPTGSWTPDSVPVVFTPSGPGTYLPGQVHEFEVTVPEWGASYDFEAEVSI